ncbi:MAG: glycosyltransferase family 2 protein [Rubellimicrobium sp.]|nr:glycosyltransferase family 2 protein [Rubellimicrobium sp.]
MTRVAAIAIGRNEGARLAACLHSLRAQAGVVVYVDSGSSDGSAALARSLGALVVELDPATPFSAARGRNEGFAALRAQGLPEFVQFVDGDCTLVPGWIAAGIAALDADPGLALVTGWREEERPAANAYHAMTAIEWHRPAGPIAACGGDMLLRAAAFDAVGGFDPAIVASEDEEFVIRLRKAGHGALRLPLAMTRHDIAMTRLRAWWRRNLRTGQGFAEVGGMHPPHFRAERRRAIVYGAALPLALVLSLAAGLWWGAAAAVAAFGINLLRLRRWLGAQRLARGLEWRVAGLFVLAKVPQFIGMARFHLRGGRRAGVRIIEYRRGPDGQG